MRTVFVGPPGSGKGTQAKLIAERQSVRHISTGDLLRAAVRDGTPTGQKAQSIMVQGLLVPDEVVNDIVAEFFQGAAPPSHFILDGYPRNVAQAEFLDRTLERCKLPLDSVILFTVPDEELVRRLNARKLAENRADDDVATIRKRLELYRVATEPIVGYYRKSGLLAEVAATGDVEAIHEAVVAKLA